MQGRHICKVTRLYDCKIARLQSNRVTRLRKILHEISPLCLETKASIKISKLFHFSPLPKIKKKLTIQHTQVTWLYDCNLQSCKVIKLEDQINRKFPTVSYLKQHTVSHCVKGVKENLHVFLDLFILETTSNQPLCGVKSIGRVGNGLPFGRHTHQSFALWNKIFKSRQIKGIGKRYGKCR